MPNIYFHITLSSTQNILLFKTYNHYGNLFTLNESHKTDHNEVKHCFLHRFSYHLTNVKNVLLLKMYYDQYETYPGNELASPASSIFGKSEREYFLEVLHLSHITRIEKSLH